jgi:phage-related protein
LEVPNEMSNDKWSVMYYETANGEEVVEKELRYFGTKEFARILRTVDLLEEFGTGLNEDYVAHIDGKIWELRISRYRVLYFAFHGKQFVLLRAFMKKTRKTPRKEIKTAQNRMDDYITRFK